LKDEIFITFGIKTFNKVLDHFKFNS